ncbi:MAG: aspartate kinase [Candidatus Cloacimonadaceae bacterium]|jgi:aspartate kinase|nr:aspartate kinase [Candidatus Cloacimonadota bacterium]MDX9949024.1 aspartate kinase [Candidatus Syntrophosphaera sp.]
MAIIVKKFGGTSVGSIELIQNIAHNIARQKRAGDSLVLVVSAMAKTTDDLMELAHQICEHPSRRELDMLLTAGERISMALLSLSLQKEGLSSISFTGSQSGIITDNRHGNARILEVNAFRINQELEQGKIVIVAGFQGVSQAKEITTLGRGGSDTSAVALACYLEAGKCEIYSDVDGVFSADPRIVPQARLLKEIDHSQMLALANGGSRVLHPRAVEFAQRFNIPVELKSSFSFAQGTLIHQIKRNSTHMENRKITAITHKEGLLRLVLPAEKAVELFNIGSHIEIFRYEIRQDSLEIFIENKYKSDTELLLQQNGIEVQAREEGLGWVTLVGLGIEADPQILNRVIQACGDFQILRVAPGNLNIGLLLPSVQTQDCLRALHNTFFGDEQ